MGELATVEENQGRLVDRQTRVVPSMVERIEGLIDNTTDRFEMPTEFVIPGGRAASAALDVARTVVGRAERESLTAIGPRSQMVAYLDRLSDLLWALARWQKSIATPARKSAPAG